jgi:hypothetical protein
MRFSSDLELISIRQYEHVSQMVNEVGKLLGAWIKVTNVSPVFFVNVQVGKISLYVGFLCMSFYSTHSGTVVNHSNPCAKYAWNLGDSTLRGSRL